MAQVNLAYFSIFEERYKNSMSGRTRVLILLALLIVGGALAAVFVLPSLNRPATTPAVNQVDVGQRATSTPAQTSTPIATPLPTQELTEIVVAVQNITRGSVIPPTALQLRPWPVEALPFNHFKNIEDVAGGIARTDIYVEQPILTSLVVRSLQDLADVGSDAAAIIPPGKRLIAVPMDRLTSIAYAIQPGDYVDIIVSFLFIDMDEEFQSALPNNVNIINSGVEQTDGGGINLSLSVGGSIAGRIDTRRIPLVSAGIGGSTFTSSSSDWPVIITPKEAPRPRLVSHITVQDALVLRTGDFPIDGVLFRPLPSPTPVPTAAPANTQAQARNQAAPIPTEVPPRPDIVALAVTPQEAVILNYLIESRVPMTFILRSAGDRSRPETAPVTLQFIMDTYGLTVPARANFSIEPAIRSIRQILASQRIDLGG